MPSQPAKSKDAAAKSENPMRDAVALTERIELRGDGRPDAIVAGFHRDGRLSLYIGDDPYYQFDPNGRLRRALVGGRLFRTHGTALAALTRAASEEAALLVRHDLDPDELGQFLRVMLAQIGELSEGLVAGAFEVVRQIPADAAIVERLVESFAVILSADGALAPAINRMR